MVAKVLTSQQYTGLGNIATCITFIGTTQYHAPGAGAVIPPKVATDWEVLDDEGRWQTVHVNDYLIKDHDGIRVVTSAQYATYYA